MVARIDLFWTALERPDVGAVDHRPTGHVELHEWPVAQQGLVQLSPGASVFTVLQAAPAGRP